MVYVTGAKGFFQAVLNLLLWYPPVLIAYRELTTQYDPGQAMILHPGDKVDSAFGRLYKYVIQQTPEKGQILVCIVP